MSAFHGEQTTADGIHVLPRYSFDTTTLMLGAAYTAADNGCCIQIGAAAPFTYFIMKDFSNSADLALGYVSIASGTGDFVGPAGATAGNAISFGDATGLVGADSGKAAANIPSSLPVQFAEGGTGATSQQTAMEGLSPSIKRSLWVNSDYTGTGTGSVNAPYQTISSALAAIGPATTGAEENEAWVVNVAPGFYDENLVFPALRSVTIRCEGVAILSDASIASSRSININHSTAPAGTLPKMARFEGIGMTGPLVVAAAGVGANLELELKAVQWINGAFAGICVDASGWNNGPQLRIEMEDCRLDTTGPDIMVSNTAFPNADVVLSRAFFCDLSGGDITLGAYSQIDTCRLENKHSWKLPSAIATTNVKYPQGYFNCSWSSPATSSIDAQSAGDFLVDATSYRRSEGISFLGSAVFTGSPYSGISNAFLLLSGADWQASAIKNQNVKQAIDRLAAAVNGLLGGGGIP